MTLKSIISYCLILLGGGIAIYANAEEKQNTLLLVLGIISLMGGVFMINLNLTSKPPKNDYVIKDEEE
ncbi:hypothetical protein [Lacinutrix chionoecetis]